MSNIIKHFRKAAIERRKLYVDYTCWLEEAEKLVDLQVVVSPLTEESPVAISSAFPDPAYKKLVIYASGGVPHTEYVVSMIVRTDAGQIKKDDIGLKVTP